MKFKNGSILNIFKYFIIIPIVYELYRVFQKEL